MKLFLILLSVVVISCHVASAARSSSQDNLWGKRAAQREREITSNSLDDLDDESDFDDVGDGGANRDDRVDYTLRLLRQRFSDMPDLHRIKSSLAILFDTAVNEFFGSFMPALARVRRETRGSDGGYQQADYLDTIVTGMGALMDRQNCRLRVTCNAGKVIQSNVPGAQVAVMLLESLVPSEWLGWYSAVKTSVVDRSDNCYQDYQCDLLPEEPPREDSRSRKEKQRP